MRLECEVRDGRYFLFARAGQGRWPVLAPGAPEVEMRQGYDRERAEVVALLAGFSTAEVRRAIRKGESQV